MNFKSIADALLQDMQCKGQGETAESTEAQSDELSGLLSQLQSQLEDTSLEQLLEATADYKVDSQVVDSYKAKMYSDTMQDDKCAVAGGLVSTECYKVERHDTMGQEVRYTDLGVEALDGNIDFKNLLRTVDDADVALSLLDSKADSLLSKLDALLESKLEK